MREFDTSRRSAGPERLRQQIFRGSDAVAEGLISASRLRREYTRVLHDIYVPAGSKILMTQQQLLGHLVTRAGVWGVARARPVFELADGRSESPAESWTRWLLHSASLPPFEPQFEVFDEQSRFIARVDFAWPANKVALEYDGSYHSDPLQQAVDQRRNAALARLGWKVLHMTSSDLHDPHRTLMELRGLLAA